MKASRDQSLAPVLVACDPIVGMPRLPTGDRVTDAADLTAELSRLQIDAAFVRHRACADHEAWFGNRLLDEAIGACETFSPVWAFTPEGEGPAFDPATSVTTMLEAGARMAWIAPKAHQYVARAWCMGELCEALQAHRIPVLLDYNDCEPEDIHDICSHFPGLLLILTRVPRMGRHRMVFPLLKQHENLHVCFDHEFSVFQGFRVLVEQFGDHRWVFGMGYPDAEGGAAITGLLYSGLSDAALEAIGHGNVERMIREVRV